jgi:hypothetical protein
LTAPSGSGKLLSIVARRDTRKQLLAAAGGAAVLAATAALLLAAQGSAHASACAPLPSRLLGTYVRADDGSWTLRFTAACTYEARFQGVEEGGGDYTKTSGDASAGQFVFSNDRGCRGPGFQDLPTPYDYNYSVDFRGALSLAPVGGTDADLCRDSKGGRATDLGDHGGWIKLINGSTKIKTTVRASGRFSAKGAIHDTGALRIISSKRHGKTQLLRLKLSGSLGNLKLSERITVRGKKKGRLTWRVTGGAGGYLHLGGGGKGKAKGSRQTLHGSVTD